MKRLLTLSGLIILFVNAYAQFAEMLRPTGFVENVGQLQHADGTPAAEVLYEWHGKDFDMLFFQDRFTYEFHYAPKDELRAHALGFGLPDQKPLTYRTDRIEYRFPVDGRRRIVAGESVGRKFSYRSKVPKAPLQPEAFKNITYKEAFQNVDLVFTMMPSGECKYDIVLREGAAPADVQFQVDERTARRMRTDEHGVVIDLECGEFRERIPESYAVVSGSRSTHEVHYRLSPEGRLGFAMPAVYERIRPKTEFIIDPIGSLVWSTFFGPTGGSSLTAVMAQTDGAVYVTGQFSGEYPLVDPGTYQGDGDVMVAKFLDADGTLQVADLVWCKLFGGDAEDVGRDIDVCNGLVAVCGATWSDYGIAMDGSDLNDSNTIVLGPDGFLMYLDAADGTQLSGTHIGGVSTDYSHAVSFDCRVEAPGVRCYVASYSSESFLFNELGVGQAQASPFQGAPIFFNSQHAILQQYGLSGLNWTTFYSKGVGGTLSWFSPHDVTVDNNGNPVMSCYTGIAGSNTLGLNTAWPYNGGLSDIVVASFSDSASLNWARWWGTPLDDGIGAGFGVDGVALAIGPGNEIYVGSHSDDGFGFKESFVSAINNNDVNDERWRVFLPSPQMCDNSLTALSVGCSGTIFAVGQTNCSDSSTYLIGTPLQTGYAGAYNDGFLAELEDLGTAGSINYLSYLGSDSWEDVNDVCAEVAGSVYVCGTCIQPNDSIPTVLNQAGLDSLNPFGTANQGFLVHVGNECCQGTITIPDGTYASVMGITTFTNETILVEGVWYIDANIMLVDCTVRVATGGEVIVSDNGNFHMDNSHISACDAMWRGIHATDGATVSMKLSGIADAQFGVWLDDGTTLWAYRSRFLNNYIGVHVKKACLGCWNSVTVGLFGCTFGSVGTGLKDPYPGQTPAPGAFGFAGIDAADTYLNIVSTSVAGNNVFKHLNFGIRTAHAGLSVALARFEYIMPDAAYGNSLVNGSAIYSIGYDGYFGLKQMGLGTAANDPVTFRNCRTSIWTERMSLRSWNNKIDGATALTGVTARFGGGRVIEIHNNNMDVQRSAIDLRFNDGAASLSVHDNDLLFGSSLPLGNPLFPGLIVAEMNGSNGASEIRNNHLQTRINGNVWQAIRLNSANNYVVSENYVEMTTETSNRLGINLTGCTNNRINCNNVQGPSSWISSHWAQAGIRHSMGDNNFLGCNNVNFTRHGILFNGTSGNTDLRGNNFGVHQIGLELTQGAFIGGQAHKGNIWNVPAAQWDARWVNPGTLAGNEISVNGSNPLCVPTTVSPLAGWFIPTGLPNDECAIFMPQCPSVNFQGGGNQRSEVLDEAVMLGAIQNGIYTDETRLMLAYELYLALLKDPLLYTSGPYTASFLTTMANSVADDLKDVELPRKDLYEVPGPVLASVQQNEAAIANYMDQVETALGQLTASGLSAAQEAALHASIASWHQSIEALNTYNTTAMASLDAARAVEAMLLENGAASLASTELIEQNAKAVNEIYLSTIGVTGEDLSFDASQVATLFDIANQCPLLGGNPVYQARSLYTMIDAEVDFDDALICVAVGFAVKDAEVQGPQITVFPNPNRDGLLNFQVTGLDDTVDHKGTMFLYDAQGQEVWSQGIITSRSQMDVSMLSQGLYQWRVVMDGVKLGQGKVTIF